MALTENLSSLQCCTIFPFIRIQLLTEYQQVSVLEYKKTFQVQNYQKYQNLQQACLREYKSCIQIYSNRCCMQKMWELFYTDLEDRSRSHRLIKNMIRCILDTIQFKQLFPTNLTVLNVNRALVDILFFFLSSLSHDLCYLMFTFHKVGSPNFFSSHRNSQHSPPSAGNRK